MNTGRHIDEAAARWFLRLQATEHEDDTRGQFEAWLMQDARHQHAFRQISETWDGLHSLQDMQTLLQAKQTQAFFNRSKRRRGFQNSMAAMAAIAVFAFSGWLGWQQYQQWQAAPVMQLTQQSSRAQILTQTLEDGSKLTLNANSRVAVSFYRHQRHVILQEGEVIFEVQPDPQRPFVVETDRAIITVLGTRFAVNKMRHMIRVSVDHGHVRVLTRDQQHSLLLHNNQVAEVVQQHIQLRKGVDASDYLRFAQGIIIFNHAQITEVAEALSRFTEKPVISNGDLMESISAVVNAKHIHGFLHMLPKIAHVQVQQRTHHTLIQPARPAKK